LVEVMQRYAVGDLSQDMDRLPGEQAVFTDAMDAAKASLLAINTQIQSLAGRRAGRLHPAGRRGPLRPRLPAR
jgi:methyl-accepting chemotaxis protein